ncbi:MAG: DUF5914 domain-containing protein [Actinomycetales bacterium]
MPGPTWREASARRIERALHLAQAKGTGGWHVVGASTDIGSQRTVTRSIAGREVVLWRDDAGSLVAGPGACPHLGALLQDCPVRAGVAYCRWHGLPLRAGGGPGWQPWAAHDDGVLAWVRIPAEGEAVTDAPSLAVRPPSQESIAAVVSHRARCEPRDIIANRLDPWHGAWFHPYAFSHLTVDAAASTDELLVVEVAYRVTPRFAVPVVAEFACPDARTIVMTITDGEGAGSVVETHATALGIDAEGHPVTVMTEVSMATSERPGFAAVRALAPLVRRGMRHAASRLWVDDLAYAERLYELRARGEDPGGTPSA